MNLFHQGFRKLSYHFRSRDKDGTHTIGSAIPENPYAAGKPEWHCFYITGVMGNPSSHCRNRNFRPFLLLWPRSWPDDLHMRTWQVLPVGTLDVQIWTSYLKAF